MLEEVLTKSHAFRIASVRISIRIYLRMMNIIMFDYNTGALISNNMSYFTCWLYFVLLMWICKETSSVKLLNKYSGVTIFTWSRRIKYLVFSCYFLGLELQQETTEEEQFFQSPLLYLYKFLWDKLSEHTVCCHNILYELLNAKITNIINTIICACEAKQLITTLT